MNNTTELSVSKQYALGTQQEFDDKIADMQDHDIYLATEFITSNPLITIFSSPDGTNVIPFEQTKDSLVDLERFKQFVDNSIRRFRKSRFYKGYKSYLMCMGMDRCQILGNIQDHMADIEMHHNFLTIYDISILITTHMINTIGKITSFDLVSLLMQEHRENNIPIVMLSKTVHQVYHDNPEFYIPLSMTFGKWWDLLIKYRYGITYDIATKVVKYINKCQENNELTGLEYFRLRESVESWGYYNEHNNNFVTAQYQNNFYGGYIDSNFAQNQMNMM